MVSIRHIILGFASFLVAVFAQAKALPVGEVVFVIGQAQALHSADLNAPAQIIKRGSSIHVGDVITTSGNAHVHVRFVDGAFLSVRPGSRLKVVDYVYDAKLPKQSTVRFDLQEGVARSITGAAGHAAKERFRLNTPVAALGVRGTDFSVYTREVESIVAINSGAVVVAPFGDGCSKTGLGTCATANAVELSQKTGQLVARVDPLQTMPQILPRDTDLAPDKKRAPDGEPKSSEAKSNGSTNAPIENKVTTVNQVLSTPATMAWGRWSDGSAWRGDVITKTFTEASTGRQVTVGNEYFGLFRTAESGFVTPASGSVDMRLDAAQVHYLRNGQATPGTVNWAFLNFNFNRQTFATELSTSHALAGNVIMFGAGNLNVNPNVPGIFVSDPRLSNSNVAGAYTSGAEKAGYQIESTVNGGSLMGTTLWKR